MRSMKLNMKSLQPSNIKQKVKDKLKPIIVKYSESDCRTCGGR